MWERPSNPRRRVVKGMRSLGPQPGGGAHATSGKERSMSVVSIIGRTAPEPHRTLRRWPSWCSAAQGNARGPTRLPVGALRIVGVVNRPSDPLDQLSGLMTTSQIRGGDALIEGDHAPRLGHRLAHHLLEGNRALTLSA